MVKKKRTTAWGAAVKNRTLFRRNLLNKTETAAARMVAIANAATAVMGALEGGDAAATDSKTDRDGAAATGPGTGTTTAAIGAMIGADHLRSGICC